MIGLIGGSGLVELPGVAEKQWLSVDTPYGHPSDQIMIGKINGHSVAFLPRHGRGHVISPSSINFRANIFALKKIGVKQLISFSAVGSLQAHLTPGTFVIVDQFIDRTTMRHKTFFDKGLVAHVSLAEPVCQRLGNHLAHAAKTAAVDMVNNGTYLVMEGPQFSTKAESKMYRSWGADVIGMTNMPEANLAREAQICYASMAMVTDYDCWHPDHAHVSVAQVLATLSSNSKKAVAVIHDLIPLLTSDANWSQCSCQSALINAIQTSEHARDMHLMENLKILFNS
ncbi:MAG: S-methyl-5'-thioadenosine phosphorylase [Gammaproteobacteria bacterium]|nr:S-methyl-5'-thioadenosine phosphorylase [Gammaproteobacteria bacterium]